MLWPSCTGPGPGANIAHPSWRVPFVWGKHKEVQPETGFCLSKFISLQLERQFEASFKRFSKPQLCRFADPTAMLDILRILHIDVGYFNNIQHNCRIIKPTHLLDIFEISNMFVGYFWNIQHFCWKCLRYSTFLLNTRIYKVAGLPNQHNCWITKSFKRNLTKIWLETDIAWILRPERSGTSAPEKLPRWSEVLEWGC